MGVLVPFDERFLEPSYEWLHDPETMRLVRGHPFTAADQRRWYGGLAGRTDYLIWGIEADGRPAGAAGFKNVTGTDAELFVYLGEPADRGRGLGTRAVRELLDRTPPGVTRVWLVVGRDNVRARAVYERLGFVACGGDGDAVVMERSSR